MCKNSTISSSSTNSISSRESAVCLNTNDNLAIHEANVSIGRLTIQQLLAGAWPTDTEINAFLTLLRKAFLDMGGLEDPIILHKSPEHIKKSVEFVRVLNGYNSHWVCVSNCATEFDKGLFCCTFSNIVHFTLN
jgi:hypothetical protein